MAAAIDGEFWRTFGAWWLVNASSLTPVIAALSALVALKALRTQRRLSRQRAAFDLLLKTEVDRQTLGLWEAYLDASIVWERNRNISHFIEKRPKEYNNILIYLSIYDFVSCGIKNEILDEKICCDLWHRIMKRDFDNFRDIIEYLQKEQGESRFASYVWLMTKWKLR